MARAPDPLEDGREAFERRSWTSAYEALREARGNRDLAPEDLARLSLAAFLVGREDDFLRALQEAHSAYAEAGRGPEAVRCAFWLGLHLAERGDTAQASGWFSRCGRILDGEGDECAERGYLLLPEARQRLMAGDEDGARRMAAEATAIGHRFGDHELLALALHVQGRVLLHLGHVAEGLSLLDEAMVTVTAEDLSPMVTGLVYCGVISACRQIWALGRAHEWTEALATWCEWQPDMVAYTGECRVYRAEALRLQGRWQDALDEARRASDRFDRGSYPNAAGFALYLQAEVHRLRGEFGSAEDGYRAASRAGYEPQPGLALLRLAQGDTRAADAAIRRRLAETAHRLGRARLLPARVEIALALGQVEAAREASDELAAISGTCAPGVLGTMALQARGSVELASNNAEGALGALREAWQDWQGFEAPYDAARVRVLLALACRSLGDEEGARLELDAAHVEFRKLGAVPDAARVVALMGHKTSRDRHGLTPREREVLALLATGRTNRAIAKALFISEKTVARHVANMFGKLGVSSRAAATAYAYEHQLLDTST